VLLDAAEGLRQASGQTHRPWELRSREVAEHILGTTHLDEARKEGPPLDFPSTIEYAQHTLAMVDEPV
jgi:hypothetical protein